MGVIQSKNYILLGYCNISKDNFPHSEIDLVLFVDLFLSERKEVIPLGQNCLEENFQSFQITDSKTTNKTFLQERKEVIPLGQNCLEENFQSTTNKTSFLLERKEVIPLESNQLQQLKMENNKFQIIGKARFSSENYFRRLGRKKNHDDDDQKGRNSSNGQFSHMIAREKKLFHWNKINYSNLRWKTINSR
ncbi:uncharacterized protein LOC123321138 [Coccinella septempunctata]|uniref:uncharacterized protein LOC123321138 n=1 Tax=Coccinella septempunctata TaxID=41139 RepID=UPI001D099BAC|nr:uncharacterized protein LOC123321138 [Coccinella septempunctata]